MSATGNPLKLRTREAKSGGQESEAPPAIEPAPPVRLDAVLEEHDPGPPPIPSTPAPLPPAAVQPAPSVRHAPMPCGPRPPARDLGLLGRLVVWGLFLLIAGSPLAGWFVAAHYLEGGLAQLARQFAGGGAFETVEGQEDMMAEFAAAMESAMAMAEAPAPEPEAAAEGPAPQASSSTPITVRRLFGGQADRGDVVWPDLQLNGVLMGSEEWKHSIVIGSDMIPINGAIEGMKVVSVQRNGAWFEYQGEQKFVEVHGRTR